MTRDEATEYLDKTPTPLVFRISRWTSLLLELVSWMAVFVGAIWALVEFDPEPLLITAGGVLLRVASAIFLTVFNELARRGLLASAFLCAMLSVVTVPLIGAVAFGLWVLVRGRELTPYARQATDAFLALRQAEPIPEVTGADILSESPVVSTSRGGPIPPPPPEGIDWVAYGARRARLEAAGRNPVFAASPPMLSLDSSDLESIH